jgi:Ca2+-binding EF-hand superfamily protein
MLERQLEWAKCDLVAQNEFTVVECFRLFDTDNKSYVTLKDIQGVLAKFNIKSNTSLEFLLFKRYDLDFDGKLRYSEFANLITPQN